MHQTHGYILGIVVILCMPIHFGGGCGHSTMYLFFGDVVTVPCTYLFGVIVTYHVPIFWGDVVIVPYTYLFWNVVTVQCTHLLGDVVTVLFTYLFGDVVTVPCTCTYFGGLWSQYHVAIYLGMWSQYHVPFLGMCISMYV